MPELGLTDEDVSEEFGISGIGSISGAQEKSNERQSITANEKRLFIFECNIEILWNKHINAVVPLIRMGLVAFGNINVNPAVAR